jgi:subtilisin-like proprotein convertase family protein
LGSKIPDPRIYTKGQTAVVTLTLPGTIGTITQTIKLDSRPLDDPVVQAFNPTRLLITGPSDSRTVAALAKFFYFTGKVVGTQGPATFYQTDHENTVLDLNSLGNSVQLYPGQTANYYFGSRVQAGQSVVSLNLGAKDVTLYGKGISIGGAAATPVASSVRLDGPADVAIPDGNMVGVARSIPGTQVGALPYAVRLNLAIDPYSGADAFLGDYVAYLRHTSADGLDSRAVKLFEHIGATTENPDGSAATGMSVLMSDWASTSIASQDSTGKLLGTYQPGVAGQSLTLNDLGAFDASGTWTLWLGDTSGGGAGLLTNWSVELEQLLQPTTEINLLAGVGKTVTMVAGSEGLAVNSSWIKANQANLSFLSTGSMEMRGTQIDGAGSQFLAEAVGKVKMGAQSIDAVNSPSVETVDREQVRILADTVTDAGGVAEASPGSMAIIRTGDSLELRNVTIRNFEGTKLEKVQNGVTTGRVLISGSSVRDFKIKELTGMAVNADAKIQMAAYDSAGRLEGEMVVENQLPVATKLASQIDNTITGTLGNTLVHAKEVELAARTVRFNDATIAAMSAITARANTILIQNSFMTVVQNTGMINMYVQSGLVNRDSYSNVASLAYQSGQLNFSGSNRFKIGSVLDLTIANGSDITTAMSGSNPRMQEVSVPQAGKVNVLKM